MTAGAVFDFVKSLPWWVFVAAYAVCAFLTSGMCFSYMQGALPQISETDRREEVGAAIFFGLAAGIFGPFGVLLAWLLSGFAKYGVWKSYRKEER